MKRKKVNLFYWNRILDAKIHYGLIQYGSVLYLLQTQIGLLFCTLPLSVKLQSVESWKKAACSDSIESVSLSKNTYNFIY